VDTLTHRRRYLSLGIPLSVMTSAANEMPMPILDEITQPDPAGMGGGAELK